MPSFLAKFARGAATAGATLYADKYQQDIRADILAKRDAVLQTNRAQAETSRRTFELDKIEAKAKVTAASPQTKIAEINLAKAEKLEGLQKKYSESKSSKEKLEIVKNIMVTNNRPVEGITSGAIKPTAGQKDVKAMVAAGVFDTDAEAWKFLKGGSKNLVVPIFKALMAQQEAAFTQPDDKGYKDLKTMLTEARELAKGEAAPVVTPPPPPPPPPADVPTIDSQSDYDSLPSGTVYIDKSDGKRYRKP